MDTLDDKHKREVLHEVAQHRPRDAEGHFLNSDKNSQSTVDVDKHKSSEIPGVEIHKTTDDETLVDVHVNNPMHKIAELLEEIKKQKAFSFTLKGSIGVAGVVLSLTMFGVFGTTHILCDKGVQSKVGVLRVLQFQEDVSPSLVQKIRDAGEYYTALLTGKQPVKKVQKWMVLQVRSGDLIHLSGDGLEQVGMMENQLVYVSGVYDSCSKTLKLQGINPVEQYR